MAIAHNVFIGWSGVRSQFAASFLADWIAKVVQSARPWMSEVDVQKGSRWLDEVSRVLADIKVGVTCLTPENLESGWIHFEAGALSKAIGERTRFCTLLFAGLEPRNVLQPLGMFQATNAHKKEDVLKLVRSINTAVNFSEPVPEKHLDDVFHAMWPKFEDMLAAIPNYVHPTPLKNEDLGTMMEEILQIVRSDSNRGRSIGGVSTADVLSGLSKSGVSEALKPVLRTATIDDADSPHIEGQPLKP